MIKYFFFYFLKIFFSFLTFIPLSPTELKKLKKLFVKFFLENNIARNISFIYINKICMRMHKK